MEGGRTLCDRVLVGGGGDSEEEKSRLREGEGFGVDFLGSLEVEGLGLEVAEEGVVWRAATKAAVRPAICQRESSPQCQSSRTRRSGRCRAYRDEVDLSRRSVLQQELLTLTLLLPFAPPMPHQPSARKLFSVRPYSHRSVDHVKHLDAHPLDLLFSEGRSNRQRVQSSVEKNLVRNPVADAGTDGLVEEDVLDGRTPT